MGTSSNQRRCDQEMGNAMSRDTTAGLLVRTTEDIRAGWLYLKPKNTEGKIQCRVRLSIHSTDGVEKCF